MLKIYNCIHLKTNIAKLEQLYGIQKETACKIDALLTNYLPYTYSVEIVKRAKAVNRPTTSQWVRTVKSLLRRDLQILNLLVELAKENKVVIDVEKKKLKQLTSL